MGSQGVAAGLAIAGGLVLALLLFVPMAAAHYRRDGRMGPGDFVALLVVPIYGLALWTYTLLPLPDPASIVCRDPITRPFGSLDDIRTNWTGSSPADLLRNPALLQVLLNVVLFMPLGGLLRWRRHAGPLLALAAGFGISLAIELTQLTGLWGIYECSYRFFDVDDLISNTSGSLLGWVVVALLVRHRPRERDAPQEVTVGRRLVGLVCDGLVMLLVGGMVAVSWRAWLIYGRDLAADDIDLGVQAWVQWGSALALQAAFVLGGGRTVGEWAIDVEAESRGRARWGLPRRLVRLAVGPGLLAVLAAADTAWSDAGAVVFVLIAVIVAVVAPTRGVGGLATATDLVPVVRPPRSSRRRTELPSSSDDSEPSEPGDPPEGR